MNVELVLVLFVALLYGPTVLWLVLRTLRGHRRRLPESFASEHTSGSQLASRDGEALDDPDAFWACAGCRSLNRRESSRCYSCRMAKDSASRPAPGQQTVSGWVPVMADDIVESAGVAGGTAMIPPAPWIGRRLQLDPGRPRSRPSARSSGCEAILPRATTSRTPGTPVARPAPRGRSRSTWGTSNRAA